jgi:putative aminopeptidase FrvX
MGAGTVQEEVGLRGARTTAWLANADVCLTLEVDIAQDIPGIEPERALVRMGKGPSLLTFDSSMVPNQPLKELVIQTAREQGIPCQLSLMARGGTDAGVIHVTRVGCPSVVLGVPTRHIHSHVGILSLDDVAGLIDLVVALVQRLDHATVAALTAL